MKPIAIMLLASAVVLVCSCNDSFLMRPPKDSISEGQYWRTAEDARSYASGLYRHISEPKLADTWVDQQTDNAFGRPEEYSRRFAGTRIVPPTGGGWSFTAIREANYFLENYQHIEDNFSSYQQYVGEAHFFRAYFYFRMVRSFGDVPYIDKVLDMDSEELYAPRTPRQEVIDQIIADLDKAIEYLPEGPNDGGTRLSRGVAQLYKSQVCLYEGTWEKYHAGTPFGVPEPKATHYLEMAAAAAAAVIQSNKYSLYSTGKPQQDYFNLFNQVNYAGHPEIMFWKKWDRNLDMIHDQQKKVIENGGRGGTTKSLIDDYLCTDGLPKAVSQLYQGDATIEAVKRNRDLRLDQSIWGPGEPMKILLGDTIQTWVKAPLELGNAGNPNVGGYHIKKGAQPDRSYFVNPLGNEDSEIANHFCRYAEVLLNYAEAKAELGTITQADLDLTINKLRDRVGMPHLQLSTIAADPDWLFPQLSPIINEVRRERRVELAYEGFREDDLLRWRAHELIVGKRFRGARWRPELYPNLREGVDIYVDEAGYIDPYQRSLPNAQFNFNPGRDYLDPIPQDELLLNNQLQPNPGW